MGKYISSIKDLVILVMTNGSQVIFKANSGEPESCFQVGMMHLLGINTPVDFKKASHYLLLNVKEIIQRLFANMQIQ